MVFVGQLTNNKLIYGMFSNRLGHGWTPVDGYGVVDAEKAVGPLITGNPPRGVS